MRKFDIAYSIKAVSVKNTFHLSAKRLIPNRVLASFSTYTRLIVLLFSLVSNLAAQDDSSSENRNLHPPLDIPLVLSGNFGELRTNHFHTGLDIKTQGVEGKKVYAVDEGYISRINISHYGYGLALYIDHPNGHTSVYAHLSRFSKEIEKIIRAAQFRQQKETITFYPEKGTIPVKKGEQIAWSGNSGSSVGPHLHFEVRETESEYPINPLLLGFNISDTKPPVLKGVKVYPLNGGALNGMHQAKAFPLSGSNGSYALAEGQTIEVNGTFGVGIHAIDLLDAASNKCGVHEIKLFVDDGLVFHQVMNKLNFYTNRYINAHKDYEEFHKNKRSYHRSFLLPNNNLSIYETVENRGVIEFNDNKAHAIRYEVKDSHGNLSRLNFSIKHNNKLPLEQVNKTDWLNCDDENILKGDTYKLFLPAKTFYEDLPFQVNHDTLNNRIVIGNPDIPVQQYFVLKLKGNNLAEKYAEKLLLAKEANGGTMTTSTFPAHLENGWVTSRLRDGGTYKVLIDTIPPKIKPVNISEGKDLSLAKAIIFTVTDNLSGLEVYNVFIDGEWKLSYFDRRKNTVTLPFDEYNAIPKGKHLLLLEAIDERGNKSVYEANFTR